MLFGDSAGLVPAQIFKRLAHPKQIPECTLATVLIFKMHSHIDVNSRPYCTAVGPGPASNLPTALDTQKKFVVPECTLAIALIALERLDLLSTRSLLPTQNISPFNPGLIQHRSDCCANTK